MFSARGARDRSRLTPASQAACSQRTEPPGVPPKEKTPARVWPGRFAEDLLVADSRLNRPGVSLDRNR
jgi:hypothetical protein